MTFKIMNNLLQLRLSIFDDDVQLKCEYVNRKRRLRYDEYHGML